MVSKCPQVSQTNPERKNLISRFNRKQEMPLHTGVAFPKVETTPTMRY